MKLRLNDRERELWVDNDEGLYRWYRRSRTPKRAFVRKHRAEIDAVIRRVVDAEPSDADIALQRALAYAAMF